MTTTALPEQIQATIHQDAISRVPDFFNATLPDILNELLQNSRRSGATKVEITVDQNRVTVSDDGRGIEDPQSLLSFGQSNWEEGLTQSENPAGMGIYSLARAGEVAIRSRTPHGVAWEVNLETSHFTGKETAQVIPLNETSERGTAITFNSVRTPRGEFEDAARHYPLNVCLNGDELHREDFLKDSEQIQVWEGIRIGVKRSSEQWGHRLNFHGVKARANHLPHVFTEQGCWYSYIDVVDCPQLRLTLPARKEVVKTAFLEDLNQACQKAVYQAILNHPDPVDVPKRHHDSAHEMGVPLPEARPLLKRWHPVCADENRDEHTTIRHEVEGDTLLVELEDNDAPDQQALNRAAEFHNMESRLMRPDPDMQGYAWYDRLTIITGMKTTIIDGGQETDLEEHRYSNRPKLPEYRPDRITVTATGHDEAGNEVSCPLDTDLVFEDREPRIYEPGKTVLTKNSRITLEELMHLFEEAHFRVDEDGDSYETSLDRFQDEAKLDAMRILHSGEEAHTEQILTMLRRHIVGHIPAGKDAVIHIKRTRETKRLEFAVTYTDSEAE